MADEWIRIGRVRSVNVPRRILRIAPRAKHQSAFDALAWVRVLVDGSRVVRCRVVRVRSLRDLVVLELGAGSSRDTVASMRSAPVVALPEELPVGKTDAAGRPERLIGFDVFDAHGEKLGVVVDAYPTGANDVAEIQTADGRHAAVPVVDEIVTAINAEKRTLVVRDLTPFYDNAH